MTYKEMAVVCIKENRRIVPAGSGKYHVVSDQTGKPFTENPLSHKKALKLQTAIEIEKHKATASMARKSRKSKKSRSKSKRSAIGSKEIRSIPGVELRASKDSGPGILVGYAAVFNSNSIDLGGFIEVIAPGAFADSIGAKDSDVRALREHKTNLVLGRTTSSTLRLSEDSKGLRFEIDLPDTTVGRDTAISVARGDLDGMSFGFICHPGGDQWTPLPDGGTLRTLKKVEIFEVSVVTFPAYTDTSVAKRSWRRRQTAQEIRSRATERASEALASLERRQTEMQNELLNLKLKLMEVE